MEDSWREQWLQELTLAKNLAFRAIDENPVWSACVLGLDLADSYYVGDKVLDVTPSLEWGGVGVLVRTGYDVDEPAQLPADTAVVDDLMEAARFILSRD